MWVCSRKVKAVLLAAFVPFLSLVMLDLCRNSDGNKTSTHYKAIIQFWGHSIANQGKSIIDKNTRKPSNIRLYLLTKLQMLFCNHHPTPYIIMCVFVCMIGCNISSCSPISLIRFLPIEAKGVKDEDTLQSLGIKDGGVLYFKDLGIQLGWSTVSI